MLNRHSRTHTASPHCRFHCHQLRARLTLQFLWRQACSKRDLVLDIHAALAKRGLKLLLYWTCNGPTNDHQAAAGMGLPGSPGAGYTPCRVYPGSWPVQPSP